jgi:hypothetical protein
MRQKLYGTILTMALSFSAATAAQAQHEHHGGQKPATQTKKQDEHQHHHPQQGEMSKMMQEPHHALAMAYHQSMAIFARALHRHAEQTNAVNADFAREAVAEVRRNFDQMTRHHHEHMQTMNAAMRAQMDAMMKQIEPHHAKVKEHLEALERETGGDRIDRQRVAQHAAELVKHLTAAHHGDHADQQAAPSSQDHSGHHVAVNQRGDQVMGFSHAKTTHHFRLKPDGGVIEVEVNDSTDKASSDQINSHLREIAGKFAAGDFTAPMLIHAQTPPGVPVMKQLKAKIKYQVEPMARGTRLRLTSSDAQAIAAIHEFLRFQIADHKTGDSGEVEKRD